MKLLASLLFLLMLVLPHTGMAQQTVLPCYKTPGSPVGSCNPVTTSAPLPIRAYGGSSGQCLVSNGTYGTYQNCSAGSFTSPLNITGTGPQLQAGGCNIFSTVTTALTPGTTVSWNGCSDGPNYSLTLGQNTTLSNPSTITKGVIYDFQITQAASGGPFTLTLGSDFTFGNGVEPLASTATSAVDMMSCFSFDGSTLRCAYINTLAH